MAEVKSYKVLSLPSRPSPDSIYWVKSSSASDVIGFITDRNGVPYPLKDLQGSGGITALTNTDGNLVIIGADNKVINISPSLLSLINSALQTETDPLFQASEASNFVVGDKSKLDGIEAGAEVNNLSDVNATDLTDGGETNLHIHDSRYYTETESDSQLQRKQNLPTGFITGLQLSINADPTKIDIAPGAYAISDFTDLENITVQIIQITNPIIGITPAYLNTGNISYIAIDINQNIIQSSSPFTNEQRRTLAILGASIHSNLTNVNVINEIKAPIVAPTNQLHDLMRAIGSFNLEGNIYGANGNNLQLDKSAGTVFGLGINANNYLNPHQLSIASQTGLTFRYRLQTGFEYTNRTTIDPVNYDNGGILTPLLNNNKWQIQRINLFQSGLTRIQPGQHQYDTLEEAESNIKVESFITETNIAENAIFRSYLIVKKNATDLSNPTQAKFIPVDKFGNVITGNTALTYTNIISALGFTPEDVANKATDFSVINDTKYPTVEAVKEQLDSKQNVLTPVNFGAFMDTELPIKLTPSPNDNFLGRDSITNEAVEFNYPIVEGYFNGTNFYLEAGFINLITATSWRTYIDLDTNLQYRWSGSAYVQIGGGGSSDTYSYWFSYTASYLNNVILYTNTPTTTLTSNGTLTLVNRIGTTLYNSYHFFNFVSATTAGSNAGTKMNLSAEGHYRQGIEAYFIFGNNDTNSNHVTAVGSYGLLSNLPNLNIANFTTDFVGVGNDPTDTNLSFYCKRINATASYLKIPTNSNFPAHTVGTDIYMLKFESNKVTNQLDFNIKLTLTNLINGAEISHTFTGLECPDLNKPFINCVNRSNRNTGAAASIRWIKTYVKQLIF